MANSPLYAGIFAAFLLVGSSAMGVSTVAQVCL